MASSPQSGVSENRDRRLRALWKPDGSLADGRTLPLLAASMVCADLLQVEREVRLLEEGGIDLLILDHLMPDTPPLGTGFDACAHVKSQYPGLPVILYTGAWQGVQEVDREDLQAKTGATVVLKEVRDPELDDLQARARELLA